MVCPYLLRRRSVKVLGEQLELALDWGREPWHGVSPRCLTRGSCVVENSGVGSASREALRFDADPAQFTMFLQGTPNGT